MTLNTFLRSGTDPWEIFVQTRENDSQPIFLRRNYYLINYVIEPLGNEVDHVINECTITGVQHFNYQHFFKYQKV